LVDKTHAGKRQFPRIPFSRRKTVMYGSRAIIVVVCVLLFIATSHFGVESQELVKGHVAAKSQSKPLVVYYSRSGTTRTVAKELARNLSCDTEEIVSRKNRFFWGTLTCIHDQLFDRDDDIEPIKKGLSTYNQFIIASPVWVHRISSPMRTFLKYSGLRGKAVSLVLTNNGNYDDEDQNKIIKSVESYGIHVNGCYDVCTNEKSKHELQQDARSLVKNITLAVNQ
jgi:multimeric flavodoxin WrbA